MSGGHFDHGYFKVEQLADDIEREFLKDGKYMTEDWSVGMNNHWGYTRPMIEADRIGDATDEERPLILAEIKSIVKDLKECSKRAKELEWYTSGDTGATSYLERLKDIYDIN